ncbi:hypothetical protein E6C27_scaffold744G00740 [Cucumis melo var. makuwa]|uniref:Uncharacterized protein n=1 Tax=Cucumis melo var. makuwa TaxID=1194695 RepID=A0A5A7TDM1_CUCMM|nr:hypothetical protein E6C27_scaffold744G00740 [Cucumis melo var. makuwa]
MEVTPLSAIQLLLGDDRAFAVRSTVLEQSDAFVVWRGDSAVNDPTSLRGQSSFYRQIHHPGKSDRAPSSFGEVNLSSAIQLLPRDDRTFAVRFTTLVGAIGRLRRLERRGDSAVNDPTSIEGRLGSFRQIHRPGKSDRAPSSFGEIRDDRAFTVKSIALVGVIERHCRLERSDAFVFSRGHSNFSDPTSIGGRSSFSRQIHHLSRSDRVPSSFGEVTPPLAIQLQLGDDRTFAIRSIALVGAIRSLHHFKRSDQAPSSFGEVTPLSVIQLLLRDGKQSDFCRYIHRPGRSDQMPSSFEEVTPPSAIQLLLGNDWAFVDRLFGEIHRPGRIDQELSSFREVTSPSAIQLLLGDDWTFTVRSIVRVGAIRHLRRLKRSDRTPSSFGEVTPPTVIQLLLRDNQAFFVDPSPRSGRAPSSFREVTPPSAIQLLLGDDLTFLVRYIVLVEAIGYLRRFERKGDSTVNDPTSTRRRPSFYRHIHRPGSSDQAPLSFKEVTPPSVI